MEKDIVQDNTRFEFVGNLSSKFKASSISSALVDLISGDQHSVRESCRDDYLASRRHRAGSISVGSRRQSLPSVRYNSRGGECICSRRECTGERRTYSFCATMRYATDDRRFLFRAATRNAINADPRPCSAFLRVLTLRWSIINHYLFNSSEIVLQPRDLIRSPEIYAKLLCK